MENIVNSSHAERNAVTQEMPDSSINDSHPNMVTGLFPDRRSAEHAYSAITSRGYAKDDINLVMSDKTRKAHFPDTDNVDTDLGNKAAEGAGVGGAIGGTLGAIAAALATVGTSLVIPGLGLVVAGPIVAALAGAGAGGVAGGLGPVLAEPNADSSLADHGVACRLSHRLAASAARRLAG
jgi:hypothetical protein